MSFDTTNQASMETDAHQDYLYSYGESWITNTCDLTEFTCTSNDTQSLEPEKSNEMSTQIDGLSIDGVKQHFECQYCKKTLDSKYSYCEHIRQHNSERSYNCEHCPRSFIKVSNFKRHINSHGDKHIYECEQCPMSSEATNQLTKQIHEHTGDFPYQCQCCPKSFCDLSSFRYHTYGHTREHLYQCQSCQQCFIASSHFKKHILIEHPSKCPHCQQSYPDQSEVSEHVCDCTGEMTSLHTPNRNYCPHSPKPKPLESTNGNRHVDSNGRNEVNVPTSNVAVNERNGSNGNVDQTAKPVGNEAKDLNFADPENSLDRTLAMKISLDRNSNPPTIGLPQPPEQSLSSTQPDNLALHQKQYKQCESSFSDHPSTANAPASINLHHDFPTNQDNQVTREKVRFSSSFDFSSLDF